VECSLEKENPPIRKSGRSKAAPIGRTLRVVRANPKGFVPAAFFMGEKKLRRCSARLIDMKP